MNIRPATRDDFARILDLNQHAVAHTSPLAPDSLHALDGFSCYHRVAYVEGTVAAFLLVIAEQESYQSDNYRWFNARYPRFLYIDRIVVDPDFAGRGIGKALYEDLFEYARSRGYSLISCEYNLEPPNPASAHFHSSLGFEEIDSQLINQGKKRVSLQIKTL